MTTAATISAKLILESQEYNKGLDNAETKAQSFGGKASGVASGPMKALQNGFQQITGVSMGAGIGIGLASAAVVKAAEFFVDCANAANLSSVELAKNEAILKATGYAAGLTSEELQSMATELSNLTGIDDKLITSAESMMLTFRNIGDEEFPRAMQAALDLQTTFGSLDSASLQLGKALNDPIAGMTALGRSGVTFSDAQKKLIKGFVETNQLAEAQGVILAEVEKQVGGTAEAMEKASNGTDRAKNAFENMQEAIGASMLPTQREFNDLLTATYNKITENVEVTNQYNDMLREAGVTVVGVGGYWKDGAMLAKVHADELVNNAQVADNMSRSYEAMGRAIESAGNSAVLSEEQLGNLNKSISAANTGMFGLITSVKAENDKYTESMGTLMAKGGELQGQLNTLTNQGYSPLSPKVQEVTDKINDNKQAIIDLDREHQRIASMQVWQLYIEKLKGGAEGFTDAEFDMAIQAGITAGVLDQKSVDMAKAMDATASAAAGVETQIQEVGGAVDSLHDKTITITTNYLTIRNEKEALYAANRATGGSASGLTWVGESGPELLDLPSGSFVHNNQDSERMAGSQGYSGPTADEIGEKTALAFIRYGIVEQ